MGHAMSDLSALERRKYVRVADAFHAGYKAAETNQMAKITAKFRSCRFALSIVL
jgi:hypothetical protein